MDGEILLKILTLVPPDKKIRGRDILATDTRITRKMLSDISFCDPVSRLLDCETEIVDDEETGIPTSMYFTYRRTPAGSDWIRDYSHQKKSEASDCCLRKMTLGLCLMTLVILLLTVAIAAMTLLLVCQNNSSSPKPEGNSMPPLQKIEKQGCKSS